MNNIINKIIEDLKNNIDKKDVQYFYFGHSYSLSIDVLNKGVIEVIPRTTEISSVTTGTIDESVNTIEIILLKSFKTEAYINASRESASDYLTRVIDGRNADGSLKTNSIRYILRNNMRDYGTIQRNMSIEYDSKDSDYEGAVSAKITLIQEEQNNQPLS
jgi:hypothetical protein